MILGLDIGRQFVKAVLLEKTRGGTKVLNTGIRLVPEQHKAFDPELIGKPLWVMAVKELMREMKINPKRVKNLITGLNGTNVSVKQITTMDMPEDELFSSMTFEARKHIPMDGSDAIIEYQVFGPNPKEVDKIDVGLVACTKKVSNAHIDLLKEVGFTPGIADSPTWHNFKKHDTLRIWNRRQAGPMEYTVLGLHAIEITPHRPPNDKIYHDRDIILYYGWTKPTNHHFWNIVLSWNIHAEQFAPGYY